MIRFDLEIHRPGGFRVEAAMESSARVSGLFGPSGSGKTTVLLALAGLLRPRRGRIEVGGRVLFDSAAGLFLPPEQRRVGYVFQDARLFPHLDVRGNLGFGARASGGAGADHGREFDEIVHLLDLEPLLARAVTAISGGEARRVAVGRALLARPEILLLDEPLTGLDADRRRRLMAYLLRLKHSMPVAMLFVSHMVADFLTLVDVAGVLERGTLVTAGDPVTLLARSLADDAGPVETALRGTVTETDGALTASCQGANLVLRLDRGAPGDDVVVTVGAEDVLLGVGEAPRTSARNVLRGRVIDLHRGPRRVLVRVDVGPVLWADVTEGAVAALGLEPGCEVYALVKAAALRAEVFPAAAG